MVFVFEALTRNFLKGLFNFPKRHAGELKPRTGINPGIGSLHIHPVECDFFDTFSTSSSQGSPSQILSGESTCSTSSSHVQSVRSNSTSSAETPQTPKKEKQSPIFSILTVGTPSRWTVKKERKTSEGNAPLKIGHPQNPLHICHVGNASNLILRAADEMLDQKLRKEFDERVEADASTYSMRPQESQEIGGSLSFPLQPRRPRNHASTGGSPVSPQKRKQVPSV